MWPPFCLATSCKTSLSRYYTICFCIKQYNFHLLIYSRPPVVRHFTNWWHLSHFPWWTTAFTRTFATSILWCYNFNGMIKWYDISCGTCIWKRTKGRVAVASSALPLHPPDLFVIINGRKLLLRHTLYYLYEKGPPSPLHGNKWSFQWGGKKMSVATKIVTGGFLLTSQLASLLCI